MVGQLIILKMKNNQNRQKQQYQSDSFFNYIKALVPFSNNNDSNDRCSQSKIQKQSRQPIMVLSSRVYNLSMSPSKKKKRVQFMDQVGGLNALPLQGKTKMSKPSLRQSKVQDPNPEQIRKDLALLQKSIYSTFKIAQNQNLSQNYCSENKQKQQNQTNSLYYSNLLPIQSRIHEKKCKYKLNQDQNMSKYKPQYNTQKNSSKEQLLSTRRVNQATTIRQSSKLTIKSKSLSNFSKQSSDRVIKDKNSSFNNSISKRNRKGQYESGQQSSRHLPQRSQIFWQQQNNLMVQIFKRKLQCRFNL